ncbi:GLPGLI family protein [Psychroflexus sp. CAK8W]|uniref:GLPGLI family protein n=1 Tax=Psychroflexus longus TaxID=2873596 RepID=A0ABS7XMH2_9FLAO|nr:GLPGLI family protein [Psychroflexus longus]MBZ9779251.1 GLPGLI family protein [Psychroflexus longus]
MIKIALLCMSLLFSLLGYTQNYRITYEFEIPHPEFPEKTEDYLKQHFTKEYKKYNQISEFLKMHTISDGNAYYTSFNKIMESDEYDSTTLSSVKLLVASVYPIYYNNGTSLAHNLLFSDRVVEVDNEDYLTWEILNETKTILGFKCFKALPILNPNKPNIKSSFMPVHVWFAPGLNFKASPSVFGDLPGAVLELENHNSTLRAIEVQETKEKPQIIKLRSGQELTTYEALDKRAQKAHSDYMDN